jgi:hypothetical protein
MHYPSLSVYSTPIIQ